MTLESYRNFVAIVDCGSIMAAANKLLIAQPDGNHILMAFGSQDAMSLFQNKLKAAYPDLKELYQEAIVA